MNKSKKEPFFNILLRSLKKLNIEFKTRNSNHVIITDGMLNGVTFIPKENRVNVLKRQSDWDKVHISLDIEVNYSIDAFFYKLFKFHILNETNYAKLLKKLAENE